MLRKTIQNAVKFADALVDELEAARLLRVKRIEDKRKAALIAGTLYREHVTKVVDNAKQACKRSAAKIRKEINELRDELSELSKKASG